mgnify:CR=1 FL=1
MDTFEINELCINAELMQLFAARRIGKFFASNSKIEVCFPICD